jgi:hypothetical protein
MVTYRYFTAFVALRSVTLLFLLVLQLGMPGWIPPVAAYSAYFYVYWISRTIETLLLFAVMYELYRNEMAPLHAIQRSGLLILRWLAALAVILAIATTFVRPMHLQAQSSLLLIAAQQLTALELALAFCVLPVILWVVRPLGLTFRIPIFGIGLGMLLLSASDASGHAIHNSRLHWDVFALISGIIEVMVACLWVVWFLGPEPTRAAISPRWLRWNAAIQTSPRPDFD